MFLLFSAPSLLPALHQADSLWPVAPWQWLGAHQGPIEPMQEEDGWEQAPQLNSVSHMQPNPAIISPSEAVKRVSVNDAKVGVIDGSNKTKKPKAELSVASLLPNWHPAELHDVAPALASYEDVMEHARIHAATNINVSPSIRQQQSTLLDLPQMVSDSLETKLLSDVGMSFYPNLIIPPRGHLSEHSGAYLQVGMDTWSSSLAQKPATLKPIEWYQKYQANLPELQRIETNSLFHSRQHNQDSYERNTSLWNQQDALPNAHFNREDGPMQVHFHQPLIGHMQVQGTTPQEVRLFKEQVEEALIDIFNNMKTMYPS